MLKDKPLDYILEQFDAKSMILEQFGERVSPYTLYEDIFGDLEQILPIVIIDEEDETVPGGRVDTKPVEHHIVPMSILEAMEQSAGRNDILLGGCTYFNNWISKKSAKDIYAFIVDIDNVYAGTLRNALQADWKSVNGEAIAKPTYLVNSGTGCHAIFVLEDPIPNYRATTANLDKVYRALAVQQTTKRVYLKKEVQWFGQHFRIVGGLNKYKRENEAFRVGEKWDIDELAKAVGVDVHFTRYGEPRMRQSTEKKRSNTPRKGWKTSRAFYDYTLNQCRTLTKEGNRYTSMCALSVIAWKCGVPLEELEQDLKALLLIYNKGAKRVVKEREIYSAMKMYNDKAILTQRQSLENWQGWEFHPKKRNGRKQWEHLWADYWIGANDRPTTNICKANRELALQYMRSNKQIHGAPEKYDLVQEWKRANPGGKKVDCARELGISRTTVHKWWLERAQIL